MGQEQAALGVLRRRAALCQLHGPRVSRDATSTSAPTCSASRSRSSRRTTATASSSRASAIKHLPESFQVNIGHPIGPYLKASVAALRPVRQLQARPGHRHRVHHARRHVHLRRRAEAQLEPGRLQHRGARRLLLARTSGSRGATRSLPGTTRTRRTTGSIRSTSPRASTSPKFRKLLVKVSYLDGHDLDRFSQWDFGPFSTQQHHGFPSGTVLADRAYEANVSYGLNIQEIVRFEIEYDQALVTNRQRRADDNTYFSGFGITTAFNGPWDGTRIRAEVGYPVVGARREGLHDQRADPEGVGAEAARSTAPLRLYFPRNDRRHCSVVPVRRALVSVHDKTGHRRARARARGRRASSSSRPAARPRS